MPERVLSQILELDIDKCQNTFGVSPCTAGRKNSDTAQAMSAVQLDGLNDYIEVPSSSNLEYTGGDLSVSGWFVLDASDINGGQLVSKPWNGSGEYNYRLSRDGSNQLSVHLFGATSYNTAVSAALSTGVKHHVTLVLKSDKSVLLYVDSVLVINEVHTIVSWVPPAGDLNIPLALGTIYPYGDSWAGDTAFSSDGAMDDVRIYTRALSAVEVGQHYSGSFVNEMGLVLYLPMDNGSGTTVTDHSASANHGTLRNGPTWVGDLLAPTKIRLASGASAANDTYNGMTVRITGGTGAGQERKITDYVGASKVATVEPAWSVNPDGTSTYDVIDRPTACYNVFSGKSPCQDKPNYVKGTQTLKITTVGGPIQVGQLVRPYISRIERAPTKLEPEEGLAVRADTTLTCIDEPDADVETDPYVRDRPTPAGGTYWARFFARNPNFGGRPARIKQSFVDHGVFDIGLLAQYLSLPGIVGNYASTPDSAANSITGDIDIRLKVAANDWTPATTMCLLTKRNVTVAYEFFLATGGLLNFYTGTAGWPVATAVVPFSDGATGWVRVTRRVSDRRVQFFTGNDGVAWTQLGADRTDSTVGNLLDTSDAVEVGSTAVGQATWGGKCYYADIRNGIDGAVVAKFDPAVARSGDKAFTSSTGEVWTINQSGTPKAELIGAPVTERFVIETMKGPGGGQVTITLKDPSKLLDKAKAPTPTSGKLAVVLGVNDAQLTLESGEGAQYTTTGWVRVGKTIIRYDGKAGDVLTWSLSSYRAVFGTDAEEGKVGSVVQQCLVYDDAAFSAVIEDLYNRAGILDADMDLAGLQAEDATWLGVQYRVTALISDPETITTLVKELFKQAQMMAWWSPTEQKHKFKVLAPASPSMVVTKTLDETAHLREPGVEVERLDANRITLCAISYGIKSPTENVKEAKNYLITDLAVDADAEGPNEYNARVPQVMYSRWFGSPNQIAMRAFAQRQVARYRDAPENLRKFSLDPKDSDVVEGQIVDLRTSALVDAAGALRTPRVLITSRKDQGTHIEYSARVTTFDRRYGFIAPAGTANYPNNNGYACISSAAGLMNDGTGGYLII